MLSAASIWRYLQLQLRRLQILINIWRRRPRCCYLQDRQTKARKASRLKRYGGMNGVLLNFSMDPQEKSFFNPWFQTKSPIESLKIPLFCTVTISWAHSHPVVYLSSVHFSSALVHSDAKTPRLLFLLHDFLLHIVYIVLHYTSA